MGEASQIVITGFMASGKTTVGRGLAGLLGCSMIDLDEVIAEREQRAIHAVIEQEGEAYFRQRETSAFTNILRNEAAGVIALGGGTWTMARNRSLAMYRLCRTVWLDAPFELCWRRITRTAQSERPLAGDYQEARRLYDHRRSLYALGTMRVETHGHKTAAELAAEIAALCNGHF